jgi:transcription elongation factor Elf1
MAIHLTEKVIAHQRQERSRKAVLDKARPCPFCGNQRLTITDWWDDDGEYDAVSCLLCKAEAPASTWNMRAETAHND